MDAVILAAGLGTRLRPHTLTTPKPLLEVKGKPLLDWTLRALPPEVDRIIVVVHYLADRVEQYLRTQSHITTWETVLQKEPRGTGDALRSCRDKVHSPRLLVLNGDDLYGSADLADLAPCSAGLLVHPVDEPRRFGIAYLRRDGTLEKLVEKPDIEGRHLANTGAYLFPQTVFEIKLTLSSRGEYEITEYVSALAAQQPVRVIEANFWLPIGTIDVWRAAQAMDLDEKMRPVR
jgi:NDP-sugar pyrophosphorylase family protein